MKTAAGLPRVVFVEDDPSVRRFVAMALEDIELECVECGDVGEALEALRERPAQLVITDLMLPGESGLALVQRLASDAALRAGARVAVFSAGVSAEVRAQLHALGVWRILVKPASLASLESCVRDGLSSAPPESPARAALPPPEAVPAQDEAEVVARHFEGDQRLFRLYKAACLVQFPHDVQAGDAACLTGDAPALRRLAHSLKTVLRSLGHETLGDLASRIEGSAGTGDMSSACAQWQTLRCALAALAC